MAVSTSRYDSLTLWIEERLVPWASHHRLLRKTPSTGHELVGLVEWRESLFWAIARAVSVIMSTVIPSLAILVLFLIKTIRYRILAALFLTLVFATIVALTTSARPAELFVATAA